MCDALGCHAGAAWLAQLGEEQLRESAAAICKHGALQCFLVTVSHSICHCCVALINATGCLLPALMMQAACSAQRS